MVFGVKSAPAVGAKGTIINMIINRWLTFPIVDMTWLDSDGKYHIAYYVGCPDNHHVYNETIIFKNMILIISYNKIKFVVTIVNLY